MTVSARTADEDLARQLAALIGVPFQANLNVGIGPEDAVRSTLSIQPVIPLSQDRNLITCNIIPPVHAEGPTAADGFGLSEIVATATCPAWPFVVGAQPRRGEVLEN
ncbi:MAG TPA: hypothetical protein VHL31_19920 [Geminicoccus sp.]|jgi:hypothetical protein|uniref:hypothetical protein n=1 Tax=Geminicoccus sp. TaxID=2024832 RepID=UPI002E335553|nr:hypothetical protein [Geminicoccus sp.]HEX2528550.1 hypothetical protein [Geminicoccus sp.]